MLKNLFQIALIGFGILAMGCQSTPSKNTSEVASIESPKIATNSGNRMPSSDLATSVALNVKLSRQLAAKMSWGDCGAGTCGSEGNVTCRWPNGPTTGETECTITAVDPMAGNPTPVKLSGRLANQIADKMAWGDCGAGNCGAEGDAMCTWRNGSKPGRISCTITATNALE